MAFIYDEMYEKLFDDLVRSCDNCRYCYHWILRNGGACRRSSPMRPATYQVSPSIFGVFPAIHLFWKCREYRPDAEMKTEEKRRGREWADETSLGQWAAKVGDTDEDIAKWLEEVCERIKAGGD